MDCVVLPVAHESYMRVQVASAVGKNTVVGKMVLSGASRAIGQSAEGVVGVGEGEHSSALGVGGAARVLRHVCV